MVAKTEIPVVLQIEVKIDSPERNLLAEVLARAFRDILNPEAGCQKNMREALAWMTSEEVREFSFDWICYQLDLNPVTLMAQVLAKKRKGERFPLAKKRKGERFPLDRLRHDSD